MTEGGSLLHASRAMLKYNIPFHQQLVATSPGMAQTSVLAICKPNVTVKNTK